MFVWDDAVYSSSGFLFVQDLFNLNFDNLLSTLIRIFA